MGDRICIMRNGRIEQVGTPLAVYARPSNTFVAQFLGAPAMNLIPARLPPRPEGLTLDAGPISGPLPAREAGRYRAAAGQDLVFGLRAEDILTQPRPGTQPFAGQVTALEALGAENLLVLDCGGIALSARVDRHFLPKLGEAVTLHADLAHMHLFDADSGDAITDGG